jgi:hypothetical protein
MTKHEIFGIAEILAWQHGSSNQADPWPIFCLYITSIYPFSWTPTYHKTISFFIIQFSFQQFFLLNNVLKLL